MGTMGTVRTGFFFTSGAGQPYSCAGLVGKVFSMRTALLLLLLAPNLHALDITTLDGKTYRDCRVGQTFPDSICILFSGGGARVKFTNLPESLREQFGYDPTRAAAFENAEAAREQQERALLALQRQAQAQRRASATGQNQAPGSQSPGGNTGAECVGVNLAGSAAGNLGQLGGAYGRTGAQYVGVRIGGPGGIYGLTYGPTRSRP